MQPSDILLIIYQGETFNPPPISYVDENWDPIDLSGCTVTMTAACYPGDPNILFQATSYNGQAIVLPGCSGQIVINIPYEELAPFAPFAGYWDLFIYTPENIATRLMGGRIEIRESVTG